MGPTFSHPEARCRDREVFVPSVYTSRVRRTQKRATIAFLVLFLTFGSSGAEWWPMTSWHLFSAIRTRHAEVWQVTFVDDAGTEAPIPFSNFGVTYAGWYSRLVSFERLPTDRQLAECDTWSREVRSRVGADVRAVIVYRGKIDRGDRVGDRPAPAVWRPAFRCVDGTIEVLT